MAGCFLSRWQAPIQAALRPGYWVPGIRNPHSARQEWQAPGTPAENLEKLIKVVEENADEQRWYINKVDRERYFLQVFTITKAQWLDVTEVELQPGRESGTFAKTKSFSSGFFPVVIPFAPLLNMIFFFVPFLDKGLGKKRLDFLCGSISGTRVDSR